MSNSQKQFKSHKISGFLLIIRDELVNLDIPHSHEHARRRFQESLNSLEHFLVDMPSESFPEEELIEFSRNLEASILIDALHYYRSHGEVRFLEDAHNTFITWVENFFDSINEPYLPNKTEDGKFIKFPIRLNAIGNNKFIEKIQQNIESRLGAVESELGHTIARQEKSFKTVLNEYQKELKEKTAKIESLTGSAANFVISTNYQNQSKEEKTKANRWKWFSMALYVAAFFWLITNGFGIFSMLDGDESAWKTFITIAPSTAIILIIAKFSSNQSKIHRQKSEQLFWFGFDTELIEPYIAPLPPAMQHQVRMQLAERLFGQSQNGTNESSKKSNDTFKELANTVKQMIDSTKSG